MTTFSRSATAPAVSGFTPLENHSSFSHKNSKVASRILIGTKSTGFLTGFTLIEILVVIGMIAVLASIVLVAINPLRQFASARNAQRASDVNAILNAIGERIAENKGVFTDTGSCTVSIPTTATDIEKSGGYDLRSCLVPTYISELPFDPSTGSNTCGTDASCSGKSYDTKYTLAQDATSGRITVCAPGAQESAIANSAPYCLTR